MRETLYWLSQCLADVPEGNDWLSEKERSTLSGLRFAKRRNDWRLGRWTAKQSIRSYLFEKDISFSSLEIRVIDSGAPEAFLDNAPVNLSISISHSNNRSFCAIGPPGYAIGCDLELLEKRDALIVADYFTPEEIALCGRASEAESVLIVNLIWSAKESVLKILREGLRRDTRSIRIDPDFAQQGTDWSGWTGYCLQTSNIYCGWWRSCDGFVYTLGSNKPTSAPKQLRVFEP
jgi:4'-phosphopantetheinyl transferase